ncbi:MAG: 9-O-acetyl-N-acetylneuraminate esterase [Lachnospiraceae bacterium]|nr:9-O-acetyl-N-acetylneuraminate esterase [Lachnospiraceae bacterium]
MKRRFNITGSCNPQRHYMVNLEDRLKIIKEDYVDYGCYFVINKGRQYGKTTTLNALEKYLENEYIVLALDFQEIETGNFANGVIFSKTLARKLSMAFRFIEADDKDQLQKMLLDFIKDNPEGGLDELFECLSCMCAVSSRPIVLMIDEVDSAGNNQIFIDFLAQLRGYYLKRDKTPIFHSVILAGVYRLKNIHFSTSKIVQGNKFANDLLYEHRYNSPWNIAVKFKVDMSFSPANIAEMLQEYETDHHTGMDIQTIAEEIYTYTSGYPVLVSSICKHIDEKLDKSESFEKQEKTWSKEGVEKAVAMILKENPPLFESMAKQLDTYADLHNIIEDIIYRGKRIPFSPEEKSINLGVMFGYLKEANGHVVIANRIFEMVLLNMFMAKEAITSEVYEKGGSDRIGFIKNNKLDMELVLKKFVEYFHEIYGEKDAYFIEKYGRKFFLRYLKPIINGTGNYYLEAQTRDERRTDVIVDYLGEQFIVELKIWHGSEYNERGEQQLIDYLDYYHKDKGYMLSFNFNVKKEVGVKEIQIGGKTIVEAVV